MTLLDQVMIGYSTGFMMLWDTASRSLLNILKSSTLLLDLCWRSEDEFYSCHSDGSFIVWDAENGAQLQVFILKILLKYNTDIFSLQGPPMDPTLAKASTRFIAERQTRLNGVCLGKMYVNVNFIFC